MNETQIKQAVAAALAILQSEGRTQLDKWRHGEALTLAKLVEAAVRNELDEGDEATRKQIKAAVLNLSAAAAGRVHHVWQRSIDAALTLLTKVLIASV
jgi:hypothetical protein